MIKKQRPTYAALREKERNQIAEYEKNKKDLQPFLGNIKSRRVDIAEGELVASSGNSYTLCTSDSKSA